MNIKCFKYNIIPISYLKNVCKFIWVKIVLDEKIEPNKTRDLAHSNFVNSDKDVSKVERESPFQKHVEMCTSVNLKNEAHH